MCLRGYATDPVRECTCSPSTIARYQKRISGPLLDRIDIHVEAPQVEYEKLTGRQEGERSAAVRARVNAARAIQAKRFAGAHPTITCNAEMGPAEVRAYCEVEAAAQPILRAATQRLQLSARAFHRVLKLARTIADLAGSETITAPHVAEALQYRARGDVGWHPVAGRNARISTLAVVMAMLALNGLFCCSDAA